MKQTRNKNQWKKLRTWTDIQLFSSTLSDKDKLSLHYIHTSFHLSVWISFSIPLPSQNRFLLSGSSLWEHYRVVSTVRGAFKFINMTRYEKYDLSEYKMKILYLLPLKIEVLGWIERYGHRF